MSMASSIKVKAQPAPSPANDPLPPFYSARGAVADDLIAQRREFIAEQLHKAVCEANLAWGCAEIGNDHGLKYHVQRMAAHARQAVDVTNALDREAT